MPGRATGLPRGAPRHRHRGLLVLTNDGELTHRITHPSLGVEKEYLAEVEGTRPSGALRRLRRGRRADDGPTAPANVSLVSANVLRMVIHEGRNRQVRRMCEAIGHLGATARAHPTSALSPILSSRRESGRRLAPEEVAALAWAAAGDRHPARITSPPYGSYRCPLSGGAAYRGRGTREQITDRVVELLEADGPHAVHYDDYQRGVYGDAGHPPMFPAEAARKIAFGDGP